MDEETTMKISEAFNIFFILSLNMKLFTKLWLKFNLAVKEMHQG